MSIDKLEKETVTFFLTQYIEDVLGTAHYATISWRSVEILQQKALKIPAYIHVQISDHEGKKLDHPILWRWSAWIADCESWKASQNRAHKQRVERFIFEKNLYLTARGITRFSGIEGDYARILAMRKLKQEHFNFIRQHLNVTLITKEEEL